MKKTYIFLLFIFLNVWANAQTPATFTVKTDKTLAEISPTMWGIFFEDINLGADGGLYAELIKNRSFEFFKPLMGWTIKTNKSDTGQYYWQKTIEGEKEFQILSRRGKDITNPRYLHITLNNHKKGDLGFQNEGFRGMGIKKGLRYDFSVLYRSTSPNVKAHLELVNEKGDIIGKGEINFAITKGENWTKGEAKFVATEGAAKGKFNIWFEGTGALDLDIISLFPSDTWKGRKGGMRADMIQLLADLKPGFMRFPGGCIVEGNDLSQRYQWKKTVGAIEDRPTLINRWNFEFAHRPTPDYYQTFGLGFFEYFQISEDIGAEPLPILNCGMACQFNSAEMVNLDELDPYVQDALDLIEFANGTHNGPHNQKR